MPTVKMPRADWETVLEHLYYLERNGWRINAIKEIEDQVYSKEY